MIQISFAEYVEAGPRRVSPYMKKNPELGHCGRVLDFLLLRPSSGFSLPVAQAGE